MRSRVLALVTILVVAAGSGVALLSGGSSPQSATGSVHPSGWGSTPKGFVLPAPRLTAVPTGEMFDTVTLSTIPARPFALAGYTSGRWPTYLPLRSAYPAAHSISIAISASHHAACLDDEPGDATPAQAGPWVLADIRAGFARPCVYGDLSEMPAIQASLRASLGSNWRSRDLLWLAWYRFTPGLVAGFDAVQWTDKALGRNLDESTVTLDFLRAAQPPYVAPKPKPVLPVCFSHRIPAQTCASARAKVSAAKRGAQQSLDAYLARGCDVLKNRERWFANAIAHDHTTRGRARLAYRKGALATTRKVEARQQCAVFAGRVTYFGRLQSQIEAAS